MISLNVNTDKLVIFTNKLERLNKTAMPTSVRNALNSTAFDLKKRSLLISSENNFINRQKNFFKANSKVEPAKGLDLRLMESKVGMVDIGGNNYAVRDLEGQESGGRLNSKAFIPLDPARVGKSNQRLVARKNRISGIKNIVKVSNTDGKSAGQRLVKTALAEGTGSLLLTEKGILFRVDSISGRKIKMSALYSVKRGRSVNVKATRFMQEAIDMSAPKIERFYLVAAKKEFNKALR